MNYSYWEIKNWLINIDLVVVGSGIVGLNCALAFKQKHPEAKIVVLERGVLPQGASTKNAGFACFGSLSELIADLEKMNEEEVFALTSKRLDGINLLLTNLSKKEIGYNQFGGYEYFLTHQQALFNKCEENLERVNKLLEPLFPGPVFQPVDNRFRFNHILPNGFYTPFEGQIETGKMMQALLKKVQAAGVLIFNNTEVNHFTENTDGVKIETNQFVINSKRLAIATNGFSKQLLEVDLQPARAQVLITKPIKNLPLKGAFHMNEGFYYFRNVDNRILLGGARNEDLVAETTTKFGQTKVVQQKLEQLLHEVILPEQQIEIEHRWSGIMAMGETKQPIVKRIGDRVVCGVRLGGMGIAIGSSIGQEIAHKLE